MSAPRTSPELLTGFWYLAMAGRRLRHGRLVGRRVLARPVLLGRRGDGGVFALLDHCPHRAMPLRHGRLVDGTVACCYHGWRFGTDDGRCREIPALVDGDDVDVGRIGVPVIPCREVQGNIWVFMADDVRRPPEDADLPPVPRVPDLGDRAPQVAETQRFACHVDWAAIGLMDPAHAAFVHASWWWNTGPRELREKEKRFEPAPLGYRLARYELKRSARPYKLLGKNISTEITFSLPGLRVEHIRGDKHMAVDLTAITPVDETTTEVHHCIYWTVPYLRPLTWLARRLVRQFLDQDRQAVIKQQEGLEHDASMMFVGDADQEARWYFALKREYLAARRDGRPFENPVEPTTLRWRS